MKLSSLINNLMLSIATRVSAIQSLLFTSLVYVQVSRNRTLDYALSSQEDLQVEGNRRLE